MARWRAAVTNATVTSAVTSTVVAAPVPGAVVPPRRGSGDATKTGYAGTKR
ncbi:hypothetical protein [Streptomyces sp. NPDC006195]|uniref:hypothetical protein n=1 Tax=unclassified Streptomyces TaxID=2593676 RepID=UPI0033A8B114